jgi:hypothetical protein
MNAHAVGRPHRSSSYASFRDEAARETAGRLGRRALRMRAIGMSAGVVVLAVAAFSATLLVSPPASEAALFGFPAETSCAKAGQSLAPWFEAELRRTARTGAARHDETEEMLATFQDAQSECALGRTDKAVAEFQTLANMIAKLEEKLP